MSTFILTQPQEEGWKVSFSHDTEEESVFLLKTLPNDKVSLTVTASSPSMFEKYASLSEEEHTQDYEQAESNILRNLHLLEVEYKTELMPTLKTNESYVNDNIHYISWKQEVEKSNAFYKVLMAFIAMRD